MLFNSYPFLFIFLPAVLLLFYLFARWNVPAMAKLWLLFASLAFYGYWDARFVPLLVASILFNYASGGMVHFLQKRRLKLGMLCLGIGCDLGLLFYFKYVNFFLNTVSKLSGEPALFIEIALPLGISFFTFTQIAYLVDIYKGKAEKGDLLNYALFVTIFPHLIAGPILHHKEMMAQFKDQRILGLSYQNIAEGIFLFTLGLFKKVAIADYLSEFVRPIFDLHIDSITFIPAWFGAISYSLQLYFDFSGYSDMAVGLGLLFNINLPINFNSPYQANSIIDFWRRWHITLSQFLRDYLYIPLGGSRSGESLKLLNLLITMLLGGLWHGAGWTYIAWGGCHGAFLVTNHLWRKIPVIMPNWLSRTLTLLAVIFAWVIFRAPTIDRALDILGAMGGLHGVGLPLSLESRLSFLKNMGVFFIPFWHLNYRFYQFIIVLGAGAVALWMPNSHYWKSRFKEAPSLFGGLTAAMALASIFNLEQISEFLYYQF